jgi:alpha-1,2-mannosyltransferase
MGPLSVRRADPRRLALAATILAAGVFAIVGLAFAEGTAKDLDVYLLAGSRFADGMSLYGVHFGQTLTDPLPYTYPPVLAAALSLVAWLPSGAITVGWTALDLALLLWVVHVSYARLFQRLGPTWPIAAALLVALLGLSAPVLSVFDLGQIGLVLLALVLADTLPVRGRTPRGVLVGAATSIKLVPGVFILYWAVTKRLRAATVAASTAAALWILVAAVRPEISRAYWLRAAFDPERTGDPATAVDQSMNGLLQRIGVTSPLVWATAAVVAIAVGMYRGRRAHEAGDELAAVTLIGIATLLASPVSWIHHAVWIVPATGVLLGDGTDRRRRVAWAATTALFLANVPVVASTGLALPAPLALIVDNAYVLAYWVLLLLLPITFVRGSPRMSQLRAVGSRVAART